jgi:hypothetical protein
MGDRYQLQDKCLFVDATDRRGGRRKPQAIPHPHVLDQRVTPAKFLNFNDEAGFVARFIVQGVDTDLIPEILRSEYGDKVKNPKDMVKQVVQLLKPYLEPRTFQREYEAPKIVAQGDFQQKGYRLDFKVNWFGTGCCKF